jgi:hypothetical protein
MITTLIGGTRIGPPEQTGRGKPVICQIAGTFDKVRETRLPAQCCGLKAGQIYRCERIAAPGHRCRVGDHTILHERMGNGYSCRYVERWSEKYGGLRGWVMRARGASGPV